MLSGYVSKGDFFYFLLCVYWKHNEMCDPDIKVLHHFLLSALHGWHLKMKCVFVQHKYHRGFSQSFHFFCSHFAGSSWTRRVKHGEILSSWREGMVYWLTFCKTCSYSRRCLLTPSDSLLFVGWKGLFLCFQEASAQEGWWEGNGPGGELPAKIPKGEGSVPESRVPDLLPAARTGTWPTGVVSGERNGV